MRRPIFLTNAITAVLFALPSFAQPLTIMPFGDSMTNGFQGENSSSYRVFLETQLENLGVDFDFVGEFQRDGKGLKDSDVQAQSGYRIEQMLAEFGSAVSLYRPDVALILAGTNNHWDAPIFDEFVERYENLVDFFQTRTPDSELVFATIPRFACCRDDKLYWTPAWVADRNEVRIPNMNEALNFVASKYSFVNTVDLNGKIEVPADIVMTADHVHLNEMGQRKLGVLFLQDLISYRNGRVSAFNIDHFASRIRAATTAEQELRLDLDNSKNLSISDFHFLINSIVGTSIGDSNLDGVFNSNDLVMVFQANQYEDGHVANSGWATGDWNGDAEFNSKDFVTAFQFEAYVSRVVPEPRFNVYAQLVLILPIVLLRRKHNRSRLPRRQQDYYWRKQIHPGDKSKQQECALLADT